MEGMLKHPFFFIMHVRLLIICLFLGMVEVSVGRTSQNAILLRSPNEQTDTVYLNENELATLRTEMELAEPVKDSLRKKRFVSAVMALPFPFGFVGAHRVMLGTKPWVPVVYIATFGGCFGLLPLVDFFVIVFSKDIEQYENNPNVFMWMK